MAKNKPPKPTDEPKPSEKTTEIIKKEEVKPTVNTPSTTPPTKEIDYKDLAQRVRNVIVGNSISHMALCAITINIHLGRKFSSPTTNEEFAKGEELVRKMIQLELVRAVRGGNLFI